MPDFAYPCLIESICAEMPSALPPEAVPNFVFTLRDMDVSQPDEPPTSSAMPPGSICETCWDQPATQLLPAPWGGKMGSCVWCAKGEGEEAAAEERALMLQTMPGALVLMTPVEVCAFAERLQTDASRPVGMICRYSSDGATWHDHITDCVDGVRYVRTAYTPIPPYYDPLIITFHS